MTDVPPTTTNTINTFSQTEFHMFSLVTRGAYRPSAAAETITKQTNGRLILNVGKKTMNFSMKVVLGEFFVANPFVLLS